MREREPARPAWDLVIFDCDGVLVDSEPIANEVLEQALGAIGIGMPLDEVVETFVGKTVPQCLAIIEGLLGRPAPADFFDAWRRALYKEFERRPVRAVAGVEAVLDALDVPTAVVSNGPLVKMSTTLGVTGLLPRFEGRIFSPDSGLPGKPQPDLFLAAAAAAGADPRRTAVIEDTATGARGARAAGMTVFGYVGGAYADADAMAAAGAVLFTDMRELPALLSGAG
ncbi:MAG: HAD-IA family hydrolase [Gammaproteobacteria bacterium]|nr:HAD-IA family hydrolase [Gammaproteobacteria bacterium]